MNFKIIIIVSLLYIIIASIFYLIQMYRKIKYLESIGFVKEKEKYSNEVIWVKNKDDKLLRIEFSKSSLANISYKELIKNSWMQRR